METPEDHLRRADQTIGAVIDEVLSERGGEPLTFESRHSGPPDPNMPTDRYGVLVRAIVSQNLSVMASRSIYRRLTERFGSDRAPAPEQVLDDDPDTLCAAVGLSRAKAASLQSLAGLIVSGKLDLDGLTDLPDEEVVAQLTTVKGIGVWSADMFLMFHLFRPDVLPVGDLSLRRTIERRYGLAGLPGPSEMEQLAEPWRPYRSLACVYLWETTHTTPQV
ncbi:MAG TPA: hypothetical protein VGM91_02635 [Conexibacter sp.]